MVERSEIGQLPPALLGAAALVAASLSVAWMWGFTVDDALIAVRYARHLAGGEGYRFNVGGPTTDGVTPLPWPFILSVFGRADPLAVLDRARGLGVLVWLGAAWGWGTAVGKAHCATWAKVAAAIVLALSVPVAAYSGSGMETPLAVALATWAAVSHGRPWVVAVSAGLAAAFRPEMLPWAVVVAAGFGGARRGRATALAVAPFIACALARVVVFGRPAPLAILAKPSDLSHGLAYAGAAAVVSLAPLLLVDPVALLRAPVPARVLALAGLAHFAAIAAAGGDWMPYARLAAPVVPSLAYAFVLAAPAARSWSNVVRAMLAVGLGAYFFVTGTEAGRHVTRDRAALVASARPYLAGARRVAALDVGWTSAATEVEIVDLAGLTDPSIAALPGGHTSKRVDPAMLLSRDPDAIVFLADSPDDLAAWPEARYPRVVEARLARSELIARHFEARAYLPLGRTGTGYVLLARSR